MPNQYLYLSSKNSENHADFNCDLPNGLRITPYSQLRVLSCRLNVDPNVLSIDSTNNVFYLGVDHWNKNYGIIPLLPVTLIKGDYDVTQPTSVSDLCQMIKKQIDYALLPYCFVRGGVTVSISDRKLTIKVSEMNIYSCPTIDLPQDVIYYWLNEPSNIIPFKTEGGLEFEPCEGIEVNRDIKWMDDNEYKGVDLRKVVDKLCYHISAPIVTGLTGGTENDPFVSHVINVDLSGFTDFDEEPDQIGVGVGLEPTEYIRFCYGDCSYASVSSDEVIYKKKLVDLKKAGSDGLSDKQVYNIEITNKYIMFIINSEKSMIYDIYNTGGSGIYKINSEFQFKYELYDDEYGSFQQLTILIKNDKTNPFSLINKSPPAESIILPCSILRQRSTSSSDNLAILINSKIALDADMISYTIACDDLYDEGVGFLPGIPAGDFGVHTSKSTNIPRLLTVLDDNVNASNDLTFSKTMMNYMADAQATANMFQVSDLSNLSAQTYIDGLEPSAECLAIDATSGIGMQTTSASYGTGIVSQSNLRTSGIEYPLFYVSIPSLPIRNYSASDSKGIENQFVCAVELEQSQSSSFYTSKIYTEQYNVLQNAQDIEVDRIRIRICDIDSVAVEALKKYTTLVLEIKDDARIEQQMFFKNLKDYIDRRTNVPQIIDYQ